MASSDLATEVRRHQCCCILLVTGLAQIWCGSGVHEDLAPGRHGSFGSHLWRPASKILVWIGTLPSGVLSKVRAWDTGGAVKLLTPPNFNI